MPAQLSRRAHRGSGLFRDDRIHPHIVWFAGQSVGQLSVKADTGEKRAALFISQQPVVVPFPSPQSDACGGECDTWNNNEIHFGQGYSLGAGRRFTEFVVTEHQFAG